MSSQLIGSHRENAEIYQGEALCKQRCRQLLECHSLPNGLFPLFVIELGHNPSSGFLWLKQQKRKEYKFQQIRKTVSYDPETTAFIGKGRLKNVTGIVSKEFISFQIVNTHIKNPSSGKTEFRIPNGLGSSFPVSAFEIKEGKNDDQKNRN